MRKTKIVCTLGPATDSEDILYGMIKAGMNVARFNFSHGDHAGHLVRLNMLQKLREELGKPVAALLDTKGPEIRLKDFKKGKIQLKTGQTFTLTPRDVEGDEKIASITFGNLYQDVVPGSRILIDDGKVEMVVKELHGEDIVCEVLNDGPAANHKGVNVPGVRLSMPYLSPKDKADILFGIEQGYDFIAASFTRSARDILDIRELLEEHDAAHIKIIAKIENEEGVNNIDEILNVSDGIMIARGDMAVEIDFTELPSIQKKLIRRAAQMGKPSIIATQMLESMITNPRPTRAEITDIANAIYDGTSAIMLSGETAAGNYPVEAVGTMAAVAARTEEDINYAGRFRNRTNDDSRLSIPAAVAHATCTTALDIGARAIITVTQSGDTASHLCKYRPPTPIIACVLSEQVRRQLNLSWGVTPLTMGYANSTDELIEMSVETAQKAGLVETGDLAVITAGVPVGVSGTTNMIKAHLVGDALVNGVGIGDHNAKGRVHLVHSPADLETIQPGDVLVTVSTNNDMLDAMKVASAIITEDGGTNSHAAIVGLTLDKPVIVGATGAMNKLENNKLITVDSARGVVHSLPEV